MDFFQRGKCVPIDQNCPHFNGSYRPPPEWEGKRFSVCLTCPLNTFSCFKNDQWSYYNSDFAFDAPEQGCIDGISEILESSVNAGDRYIKCKCTADNCNVCEKTECDKCQGGYMRKRSLLNVFSCFPPQDNGHCDAPMTKLVNNTAGVSLNHYCMDLTTSSEYYAPPNDIILRSPIGWRQHRPSGVADNNHMFQCFEGCMGLDAPLCDPFANNPDSTSCLSGADSPQYICNGPNRYITGLLWPPGGLGHVTDTTVPICEPGPYDTGCQLYNVTNSCQECNLASISLSGMTYLLKFTSVASTLTSSYYLQ